MCCNTLFTQVMKISAGYGRDFYVKMWGTSSRDGKLTGDPSKAIEDTRIGGLQSDYLTAGKSSPGNFGVLQQILRSSGLKMRAPAKAGFDQLRHELD
jgi:hypothetical protein